MRVLVACEFSGIVRDAFIAQGHDAISCDLLPSERPGPHVRGDVLAILGDGWDLMIAHPPCTHLAVSGARHFWRKHEQQTESLEFVSALLNAPIPHIALENPVSIISSRIRPADQIVQPWQFGYPETKATCLWLKNLPTLKPTHLVEPDYARKPDGSIYRDSKGHKMSPTHYQTWKLPAVLRGYERSRTYQGIADAMAEQWGRPQAVQLTMAEQWGSL